MSQINRQGSAVRSRRAGPKPDEEPRDVEGAESRSLTAHQLVRRLRQILGDLLAEAIPHTLRKECPDLADAPAGRHNDEILKAAFGTRPIQNVDHGGRQLMLFRLVTVTLGLNRMAMAAAARTEALSPPHV